MRLRARFPSQPFPDPCRSGSFSRAFRPLRSLFARPPCRAFSGRRLLPGVSSLFAASPAASTRAREHTRSRFVPSSGFHGLSTGCSATGSAGLFRPAATSRVSVQGFDPALRPRRLVASRSYVPFSAPPLTGCPAFTTARCGSEALIRVAIRFAGSGVGLACERSPLRFRFLLQVPTHPPRPRLSPGPPPVTLPPASSPPPESDDAAANDRLRRVHDELADDPVSGAARLFEVPGLPGGKSR